MRFFFLDAGGAVLIPFMIIIFMIVIVLLEAIVMLLLKLNKFGKCLSDSLLVNLASLFLGFLIFFLLDYLGTSDNYKTGRLTSLLVMFVVTIVVEGLLLKALNKKHPGQKIWTAAVIMNILSYLILYFFFIGI